LNLVVGRSKLVKTALTRTAAQVFELTFGMVRKCAAELLLLALVGHVAAGIVDPDSIQHDDDEPKFVEVTIRELEESDFVGKIDASVILFPEPLMTGHERVRRAGNGKSSSALGAGWSNWTPFASCSGVCGAGSTQRRRFCKNAAVGSSRCPGAAVERKECTPKGCGAEQQYDWGQFEYNSCSRSCGGGVTLASRQCFKKGTRDVVDRSFCEEGPAQRKMRCNTHPCAAKEAFAWTAFDYGECDVTCGNGVQFGFRSCVNKVTMKYVDSTKCQGDQYITRSCNNAPCNVSIKSVKSVEATCGMVPRNKQGPAQVNLRIHGGDHSMDGEWPWQVSLQHKSCKYRGGRQCEWKHLCGGSIVDNKWIVTAAHCIEESGYMVNNNDPGDDWAIVVGMNKLNYDHEDVNNKNSDGTRFLLEKIVPYSEYRFQYITHHDIALLKLRTEITYEDDKQPICLGGGRVPKAGSKCFISGWGYTTGSPKDTKLSYHLKDAEIPVVSFNKCRQTGIWYKLLNEDSHMCAGDSSKPGLDSCGGDSGGPLSCLDEASGQYYLAGVTSFGFSDCGKAGHLGIYARMETYEPWVHETIEADKTMSSAPPSYDSFYGYDYSADYKSTFSNGKNW